MRWRASGGAARGSTRRCLRQWRTRPILVLTHGPGHELGAARRQAQQEPRRALASPRRPRRRAAGAPAGRGCSQMRQSSPCSCPGCCPSRASTRTGSPAASRPAGPPGFAAARPLGPVSTGGALRQPRSMSATRPLLGLAAAWPVAGCSCAQVPSEDAPCGARLTARRRGAPAGGGRAPGARARTWGTRSRWQQCASRHPRSAPAAQRRGSAGSPPSPGALRAGRAASARADRAASHSRASACELRSMAAARRRVWPAGGPSSAAGARD